MTRPIKFDGRRWYVNDRQGRKVYWARIVLADKIGRPLQSPEVAHHINGDCADDRPENLEVIGSHSDHARAHYRSGDWHTLTDADRARGQAAPRRAKR